MRKITMSRSVMLLQPIKQKKALDYSFEKKSPHMIHKFNFKFSVYKRSLYEICFFCLHLISYTPYLILSLMSVWVWCDFLGCSVPVA